MCFDMPRNIREWALRKIKESSQNIDWALFHLMEVSETYKEQHPEISAPIEQVAQGLIMIQETINQIRGSF